MRFANNTLVIIVDVGAYGIARVFSGSLGKQIFRLFADGRNYGLWAELVVYQLRGVTIEDAQAAISCMCIASMAYRGLIFWHTSQDHPSPSITCNDGL